jgi:hypothetical protein
MIGEFSWKPKGRRAVFGGGGGVEGYRYVMLLYVPPDGKKAQKYDESKEI